MSKKTIAKKVATPKRVAAKKVVAKQAGANTKKEKKVIESRHISELAPRDARYLEDLLRQDPKNLTEGEIAHLEARAAYLTSDERKKYGIE